MIDPIEFIRESNRIENIIREPTTPEIEEFRRFMDLKEVTVKELVKFVSVYQPGARLRDKPGMNVRVGLYRPPEGGSGIVLALTYILQEINLWSSYKTHLRYESLHPFTDGNGRSGRMLWAWRTRSAPLGFLHTFYYQALAAQ